MSCQIQLSGSRPTTGCPNKFRIKIWKNDKKNPWKFVYILAKQCRSHFNLTIFFFTKKNQNFVKKKFRTPCTTTRRSRARENCFRKEQKFLTFLYFSAFSQNCWKERRKERREEETGVNNGPSFSKSTWWISTEFLWSKFLLLLLSAAYY